MAFAGAPSDVLVEGKINGVECVLLARHGRKHSIMPSNINYRANIWALKNVGCTHIIVSTATGSLQENIKPGDIVILDNFIDRTTKRNQTFYDGKELSPFGKLNENLLAFIKFLCWFLVFFCNFDICRRVPFTYGASILRKDSRCYHSNSMRFGWVSGQSFETGEKMYSRVEGKPTFF